MSGNILNFCEVGLKISGITPISNTAILTFFNTSLSAVAMATTGQHVLAFLGTSDGKIKKVHHTSNPISPKSLLFMSFLH